MDLVEVPFLIIHSHWWSTSGSSVHFYFSGDTRNTVHSRMYHSILIQKKWLEKHPAMTTWSTIFSKWNNFMSLCDKVNKCYCCWFFPLIKNKDINHRISLGFFFLINNTEVFTSVLYFRSTQNKTFSPTPRMLTFSSTRLIFFICFILKPSETYIWFYEAVPK